MEICQIHRRDLLSGNFPLNHDCILKVYYNDVGLRYQYFSCRAQDSGAISLILSNVFCVHKVVISSVDDCINI